MTNSQKDTVGIKERLQKQSNEDEKRDFPWIHHRLRPVRDTQGGFMFVIQKTAWFGLLVISPSAEEGNESSWLS